MYQIIKRKCEGGSKNGLMLLDMPTGSGKTYFVVRYIYDAMQYVYEATQNPDDKRTYFFITTLKKNLPENELRKHFEAAGQMSLFREKFLRLEANYEGVIAGYSAELVDTIPAQIRNLAEFRALEQYVKLVLIQRSAGTSELRDSLRGMEDVLREEVEPAFRSKLRAILAATFPRKEDRLQAIRTKREWQWVAKLYPAVFLRERQIIFTSMDKFLMPCSTLVEPSTLLYRSDIVEKAVIFIDEFDATKETIQKVIIQSEMKEKIDCLEFFKAVYSALHTHRFPVMLTTPSEWRLAGKYRNESLQGLLDLTVRRADELYDTFSLQYSHKTERILDEQANNFLFQDHQYYSILNGDNSFITAETKEKERINEIRFSNRRPGAEQRSVKVMLRELYRFIYHFMRLVDILATNYQQCKDERRKPGEDSLSQEEAVRTVLAEFQLPQRHVDYLTEQILTVFHGHRREERMERGDLSFYNRGFRYYAFEDDFEHDMQSKITMHALRLTPEKLLLQVCRKAKVIGISATATIPSVIGNYDIDYLRCRLGDKYAMVTEAERARLEQSFREATKGYGLVSIHTKLVGCGPYSASVWEEIAENADIAAYMAGEVERACLDDADHYDKARYVRIVKVFKEFLLENRIQSFLCVLTKHPRINDPKLDILVLKRLFGVLIQHFGVDFDLEDGVVQLDGQEYDEKKDAIIQALGQGERRFVLSVYQTVGAGQNLQYPIPVDLIGKLIAINDRPSRGEKDFDAIYLDMPTHLLTQLEDDLEFKEFVRYLVQVEMLQEAGELSMRETKDHIRAAFQCYGTRRRKKGGRKSTKKCPSVMGLCTRMVIQAVGRMCRTNQKSPDIFLFADDRLVDYIDYEVCRGRMLNPEFVALMNALEKARPDEAGELDRRLENRAEVKAVRGDGYIKDLLWGIQDAAGIAEWKAERQKLGAHPTITEDQYIAGGIAYSLYVELPVERDRMYYTEQRDFRRVHVSFMKKNGAREVSADSCNLTKLMRLDYLKRHLEEIGWATEFKPGKYILSPSLFNNVYCGALGEVVGRELFSQLANVKLQEIEDVERFEKFDFVVPNSSIFVDFKNWHEGSFASTKEELPKLVEKARKCGCKCVIVANILAGTSKKIQEKRIDGIRVVTIPALLSDEEIPRPVEKAWRKIREYVNEFANPNQSAGG